MEYKDPIEVSPKNYRLLLEDGDYRMVEMRLPAGTSDIEHSHPNEKPWTHRVENIGTTDIKAILFERA